MGKNTLLSFPESKPLKNRVNIVLSSTMQKRDDCVVVNSLNELKGVLNQYTSQDVFVIGGAMVYETMLDYCDSVYLTKVNACGNAQVFFPNLDKMSNWQMVDSQEPIMDGETQITFCVYKNSNPKPF